MKSFQMNEAQLDAYHKWIELDAEAVGWNLQRQFQVVPHVAAAIVEKLKCSQQWSRAQAITIESANRRIAWLESKVDPELLKHTRDEVSCKPPAEASD